MITNDELVTLESFIDLKKKIYFCPREIVFQAEVVNDERHYKTNGIHTLSYDTVTFGAYTDILVGYTVDIGTTPGSSDIGKVRVRKAPTSTKLYIGLISPGELPVTGGHHITVREERMIWQKMPLGFTDDTVSTMRKDYDISYTNQNDSKYPKANIIAKPCGYADPGETFRTVLLDGGDSEDNFPEVPTFTWDIVDGTLLPGYDLNDREIEATFPVSRYWRYVSLTILQDDGKTDTQYFPIIVDDGTRAFVDFRITSSETDIGRTMSFTVFGDTSSANGIEKTQAIFCEEPYFKDDSDIPFEYIDQFIGWIPRGLTSLQARSGTFSFDILGPLPWLELIGGYGETIKYSDAPEEWDERLNLNGYEMIEYVLRWNTNAFEVCSFITHINSNRVPDVTATDGSITSQCLAIAEGERMAYFRSYDVADMRLFRIEPFMKVIGERSFSDAIIEISQRHLTNDPPVEFPEEFMIASGSVTAEGHNIGNGKEKKVAAIAPGKISSYGPDDITAPYQSLPVLNPVNEIREFSGHYWKYLNGQNPPFTLPLSANLDVVNPGQVIIFNYDRPNIRDMEYNSVRLLVEKVSRSYSNERGTKKKSLSWTVRRVTEGEWGDQIPPPSVSEEIQVTDPPPTFEDFPDVNPVIVENPIPTVGVGLQANRILVLSATSNKIAIGISVDGFLDKGMSTFTDISTGLGGIPTMAHVDPYNFEEFFVTAYDGLYVGNPLSFTSWALIDDPTAIFGAAGICGDLHLSINRKDWAMILSGNAIAFTANVRAVSPSWVVKMPAGGAVSPAADMDGMTVAAFQNLRNSGSLGRIHATYGSWPTFTLYKNDLWGLSGSFATITTFGGTLGSDVVVPYKRDNGSPNLPDTNEEIIFGAGVDNTGQSSLSRGKLSSLVDISQPEMDRAILVGQFSRRALVVRDDDPDWIYTGKLISGGGSNLHPLYLMIAKDGDAFEQSPNPAFIINSTFQTAYPAYGITLHPTNRENVLVYLAGHGDGGTSAVFGQNVGGLKGTPDGGENWVDLFDGTNLSAILGGDNVSYAQYL